MTYVISQGLPGTTEITTHIYNRGNLMQVIGYTVDGPSEKFRLVTVEVTAKLGPEGKSEEVLLPEPSDWGH